MRLVKAPCFWFALAASILFALQQCRVFPTGMPERLVEAGMLVCVLMAGWFPGLKLLTSGQVVRQVQQATPEVQEAVRKSLPPPPKLPGAMLALLFLFVGGCATVGPALQRAAPVASSCDHQAAPVVAFVDAVTAELGAAFAGPLAELVERVACEVYALVKTAHVATVAAKAAPVSP